MYKHDSLRPFTKLAYGKRNIFFLTVKIQIQRPPYMQKEKGAKRRFISNHDLLMLQVAHKSLNQFSLLHFSHFNSLSTVLLDIASLIFIIFAHNVKNAFFLLKFQATQCIYYTCFLLSSCSIWGLDPGKDSPSQT